MPRRVVVSPVWFIPLKPNFDPAELQALTGSGRFLKLEEAVLLLRKGIRPTLIVLLAPPDARARQTMSTLRNEVSDLPFATLAFWPDDTALKEWLNQELLNSVRPIRHEPVSTHNPYSLSRREGEILRFMVKGLIKKEIASELSLSPHTVDNHQRRIFQKLNVHTRSAAVAKAIMERLC